MKGEGATYEPEPAALERAFSHATAAELAFVAHQYVRGGAVRSAIAVCELGRRNHMDDPGLWLVEAMARFGAGEHVRALALVEDVLAVSPANLGALSLKANMLAALGNRAVARELLHRVVSAHPDYPGALPLLAVIAFPGPPYKDVLARLHRLLSPGTYLEIGVDAGGTLALAATASIAVGVDPEARAEQQALPPGARLFTMESDAFFAEQTPATAFDGRPVDLTFIDGMHWFEYALRDFTNAERWSTEASTIVLHDCLPVAARAARRERESSFWVGDVWKVLEALLDYRPDLRISVVPTAPSGLVVVRGLDPKSDVLRTKYDEIVSRYRDLEYPSVDGAFPSRYPIVENADEGLRRAITP